MISSTVEDYLKTVLKMEDMNEKVSTSGVARHLDVTDASVTDMLRKLQKAGLLEYKPYYGATLTQQGRMVALRLLRRHRLIELFLHRIMGYGWEQVHDEAEKLEHVVSDLFIERLDALLNHPVQDPHGEIIPDAQGYRELENDIPLAEAQVGHYAIRRVINSDPEFLAYLKQEGLLPANTLSLLEKAPFQGPLKLLLTGSTTPQYIGLDAAKSIYVSPCQAQASAPLPSRKHRENSQQQQSAGHFTSAKSSRNTRRTKPGGKKTRGKRLRNQSTH